MSSMPDTSQLPIRNELLAALPGDVLAQLRPHLRRASLVFEQEVHGIGNPVDSVYFPESGLVSLTADTGDNGWVEVGLTGREGMVGVSALLNPDAVAVHRALVQIAGTALRVDAVTLRRQMDQQPALRDRCLRYSQFLMVQTSQAAACNARHELPERLARWLLMTRDRVDSDEVPMTQEFLSYMLGVRRAGPGRGVGDRERAAGAGADPAVTRAHDHPGPRGPGEGGVQLLPDHRGQPAAHHGLGSEYVWNLGTG